MRSLSFSLIAVLCLVGVAPAEEWTFVSSPNFELYTTAGSGEARRTIEYFEQVRDFFSRARSLGVDSKLPVTIVLFRNLKEFKPYSPSEAAAAFYTGDNSRDYIVMSGAADDDRPVAVHEFMHLLVRRGNLKLPVWLNEGVAELYSTVMPYANKVAVGAVPKGRAISLQLDRWMPLSRLIGVQHDSPEYNNKQHAGAFYAQSWFLTHMLALGDGYRADFGKFLVAMTEGASTEEALSKVYSKSVPEVERDLQAYFRTNSLKVALFDTKLKKVEGTQPGPADAVLVDVHLARILASTRRAEEAASRMERLASQHPGRWEVQDALAQIAWRRNKLDEARAAFARAVDLKPPVWNIYYDYARLSAPVESEWPRIITALRETIRLNPAHLEAKIELGEQYYRMHQPKEALEAYKAIRSVTPELAARLFLGQAWANLCVENLTDARLTALSALKNARDDRDKDNANRILDFLNRRREVERAQAAGSAAAMAVAPPPATGSSDAPATFQPGPRELLSTVRGVLKQVDCDVSSAKLTVVDGAKTLRLLIANPDAITIRNEPGSTVTLTCGAQAKVTNIVVEFRDKVDAKSGTLGEVRSIEFLAK